MSKPFRLLQRAALALALTTAAAAGATDFKYWDLDDNGFFQAADLSLGNAKITPPAWACGRRFFSGAGITWTGETEDVILHQDIGNAVNVYVNRPAAGSGPRPRVENHPAMTEIAKQIGTHYLRIEPSNGGHWFDRFGKWPACNHCALPGGFTTLVDDKRWVALDKTFQAQLERAGKNTDHPDWIVIESMSPPTGRLQQSVAAEVSRRRLTLLGSIESSVRELEDLALSSMNQAQTQLEACRVAQAAGARGEAYKACSLARQAVLLAHTALRTVRDEVRP